MWTSRKKHLDAGFIKLAIDHDSVAVSYAEVIRRRQWDREFRSWFVSLLADSSFPAFRWETPPITVSTANRPFEFVLLDSPNLVRKPDVNAFAEHFDCETEAGVVEFPNLGNDAIMIVPCPKGPAQSKSNCSGRLIDVGE